MAKQAKPFLDDEEELPVTIDIAALSRAQRGDLGMATRIHVTTTDNAQQRSQPLAAVAPGRPALARASHADNEEKTKLMAWAGK
jgi:hypothetical protein